MSKLVDERVVEMTFDNKDFEKNVNVSMSTIDRLKSALNFTGATKGLDSVSNAAKRVDMSALEKSVDSVRLKFNALQVAGVTAIANITNSIVNAGKGMVNSFTIDPITSGLSEYELQMNSIQTILANTASKGTTIDQVTDALAELNEYADKTIYNFAEMTRNIGTFTAAGVDLDTSVASIKGIANLAAMSGSSSTQAATAMYQLSQALAAGRVSLMDWNSVVNAGMGGEQFQEALKRTARAMGIAVDDIIAAEGSFRDSLTKGEWLTSDVLTETLKQISGAYSEADLIGQGYTQDQAKSIVEMARTAEDAATKVRTFTQLIGTMQEALGSGWATTWQTIFGDFYTARDFWTSLSDMFGEIIGKSSDARNELFGQAFDSSWDQVRDKVEATGASFDDFEAKIREVGNAAGLPMDDIINKAGSMEKAVTSGAVGVDVIREAFKQFASSAGDLNGQQASLNDTFTDFSDTVKSIWTDGKFEETPEKLLELSRAGYSFAETGELVKKIANGEEIAIEDLTDEQLKSIGATDEQLTSLQDLAEQVDQTGSTLDTLFQTLTQPGGREIFFASIKNVIDAIIRPIQAVSKAWHEIFSISPDDIYNILGAFEHFTESLIITEETSEKLTRTFKGVFAIFSIITSFIGGAFSSAFRLVQGILDNLDMGFLDLTASWGDAAVAFADFVNKNNLLNQAIDGLADGIAYVILNIQNFVEAFKQSETAAIIMSNLKIAFDSISKAAEDFITTIKTAFTELIDNLHDLENMEFDDVVAAIDDFVKKATEAVWNFGTEAFDEITTAFDRVIFFITKNVPIVQSALQTFGDAVGKMIDNVMKWVDRIGPGGLVAILISAISLAAIIKFTKVIAALTDTVSGLLGGVDRLLDNVGQGIKNFLDAKAFTAKTEGIINIAIAIGIIAAAMFALGQLDPSQLFAASVAVIAIAGGLALVTKALSAMGQVGFDKVGLGFAGIGAAVALIASAFVQLSSIDQSTLSTSLGTILIVLGALTAMTIAIEKFGGGGTRGSSEITDVIDSAAIQILALAGAVRLISDAFVKMAELDASGMQNAIVGMIVVLGSVAGLMAIMNKFSGAKFNGFGLIAMAIGIQAVLAVLFELANIDVSSIIGGLPQILTVIGLLALVMKAMSIGKGGGISAGLGLLGMAASVMIIYEAIKNLGSLDAGVLDRGTAAVTKIMAFMALISVAMGMAGANSIKSGAGLLLMSAGIMVLVGAISLLAGMEEESLDRGTNTIIKLMGMFAIVLAASGRAKSVYKELIAMVAAIGVLTVCVTLLSTLDPDRLQGATIALSSLMGVFAIMELFSGKVGKASSGMFMMLGVVAVLALVVGALSQIPMESSITTAASLSILLLSMSASLLLVSKVGNVATGAITALYMVSGVVAILAVVLGALAKLNVEPSIETATALSTLLVTMTGVTLAMAALGMMGGGAGAVAGTTAMIAVVTEIGAFLVALGALNKYVPQVKEFIDGGMPLLNSIGTAIGSFFGSIVSGFATGATANLPQVAESLTGFAEAIQPFIKMMSGDTGTQGIDSIQKIVDMLTKITANGLIEKVAEMFGVDSMGSFKENLTAFGEAIVDFSDAVSGNIDAEAITAAATAGKALAEMQSSLQGEGGLFEWFTGKKDLGNFGDNLVDFAEGLKDFSDAVSGDNAIDIEAIQTATQAGQMLSELQNGLASSGDSVLKFFAGEKSLEHFADNMTAFGDAIVAFSDTVSKEGAIDTGAIENAKYAGQIMSELEKNLDPTSESVMSFFSGDKNLETFGTQMKAFGEAIVGFSGAITEGDGIDIEAIENAAAAGSALSELANSLPEYGIMDPKLDLYEFGNQLTSLATNLVTMATTIGETDFTNVNTAVGVTSQVQQILSNLQGIDESVINKLWVLENLATDLKTFATSLVGVNIENVSLAVSAIQKLVGIVQSVQGITGDSTAGFAQALSNLANISYSHVAAAFNSVNFASIGENAMAQIASGFTNGSTSLAIAITTSVSSATTIIEGAAASVKTEGTTLGKNFAQGISDTSSDAASGATTIVNAAVNALSGHYYSFSSAGYNLALGFANGISAGALAAATAARAMAQAAVRAAEEALAEHSPSRVMYRVGAYAGQGFINGLAAYNDKSYFSGHRMAESLVSGISSIGRMLDKEGRLSTIGESFENLSKALRESDKGETESTEKVSELADALDTLATSISDVVSRKVDLESFNDILNKTGHTLSDAFLAEMLDSSGQFAGAMDEMVKITDEQLNDIVYAFEQVKKNENLNILTDALAESIREVSSRESDIQAMGDLFARTGVRLTDGFVKEVIDASGQYAGAIKELSELTDSELQTVIDAFNQANRIEGLNTLTDSLTESLESISSRTADLTAMADIFTRTGLVFSEEFVKEIISSSGEYAGAIDSMAELTDEQIQSIADIFEQEKVNEKIDEITEAIMADDGLMYAFRYCAIDIDKFLSKVEALGVEVSDVTDAITSMAEEVSDGFNAMSYDNQTTLDEFTSNLRNNLEMAVEFQSNVAQVFAKIGNDPNADAFRKAVLEGGFSQYGQIISDLADATSQEVKDFIDLFNVADIYGNIYGLGFVDSLANNAKYQMETVGSNISNGLASGLNNGLPQIIGNTQQICTSVRDSVTSFFGIHSPSTLMIEMGGYLTQGLAQGINNGQSAVLDAARKLSQMIKNVFDEICKETFKVKVTVELSGVTNAQMMQSQLSGILGGGMNLSQGALASASSISRFDGQNGMNSGAYQIKEAVNKLSDKIDMLDVGATIFNQYNTSPKALSTADIYRQTKNQISLARAKVNKNNKIR